MKLVRLFVSSPSDAFAERKRVVRVIERLNADFSGTIRIETVLWEDRFYSAHEGFQPQIPKSIDCDVVIAILRGRLGTPLSREFAAALPAEEQPADGASYASGTAYEILTAIAARKRGKDLPDIFVFRYPQAPLVALDSPHKAEIEDQWQKLKSFAEQVFVGTEGHFKGAYQTFASTDDFEFKVEGALRQWLAEHVLKGRAVVWPIATRGSPFRGLEPFGAKHADVFFGRSGDRVRALDQLNTAAEAGFACLVIVGPSGAGKSSFARAGLLPWLVKPGAVSGVAVWRTAVMRPSDHVDGAFASLAGHLFDTGADIADEERGRPDALPELAQGETATPRALAERFLVFARGHFARPDDLDNAGRTAMAPILRALKIVTESEQKAWSSQTEQSARLLVIIDQLDEMFAAGVTEDDHAAFARLISALARTGAVWVVATLRAESYDLFLKSALATLATPAVPRRATANDAGPIPPTRYQLTFNLLPPGLPEMSQVVRGPATAAGLEWETDAESKERLDDRLLADIDRPDLLPLVQFVLERLFEQRVTRGDQMFLTFAAYRALGRLDGAIDTAAQQALDALAPEDRAALPRLLRLLVSYPSSAAGTGKSSPMLRSVPLAEAAFDEPSRRLVRAMTDARILISTRNDAGLPVVSLAHQRVIEAWGAARTAVAESESILHIRGEVEAAYTRWSASGGRRDRLIPAGLALSEAEAALQTLGDELPQDIRAYIQTSGRAARLRQRLTAAAALVFFVVAAVAAFSARSFLIERDKARQNFVAATQAIDGLDSLIWNVNQGVQNVVGIRLDTIRRTLDQIRSTVEQLNATAPQDIDLIGVRAAMLNNFVDVYLQAGAFKEAQAAAEEAVAVSTAMADRSRRDPRALRRLAVSLYKRADVRQAARDPSGRVSDCENAVATASQLTDALPHDSAARRILWVATEKLAEAELASGATKPALTTFSSAVTLAHRLVDENPRSAEARRDLAISIANRGDAKRVSGDVKGAAADYQESLAARRELARENPGNALFGRDLVLILARIANADLALAGPQFAPDALDEALGLARALAGADPASARARRDVAVVLTAMGDARFERDRTAARQAYEEGLKALRGLLEIDGDNSEARLDLAKLLAKIALAFGDAESYGDEALRLFADLEAAGRLSPREESDVALLRQQLRP